MSEILSQINGLYLCREAQINQLYEYLSHPWPTIVVYGPRSTAKSGVVKAMVNRLNLFHAWVNCLEVFNNKIIFETILSQLKSKNESQTDLNVNRSNTCLDLVENLKPILRQFVDDNKNGRKEFSSSVAMNKCVIVFDNSEHLFTNNNNTNELMTTFTNLQQLTDNICHISCLFISRQSLEWFSRVTSYPSFAIQINFTNYTTEQMSTILLKDCPNGYNIDFYSNYVNIILKTLTSFTRNLSEIRNFCLANFTKYIEPIITEEMTTKDSAKLYKRFQPILIQLIDQIPLKVINKSVDNLELPVCVMYLLISAYLSSYNSVKTDKKYFVKYQGKKKDRKRKVTTEEKECNGPKAFSFERMLHIYKSILQLNAENSVDDDLLTDASNKIFAQIEELVSRKLIHKIHSTNKNNSLSSLTKFQISDSVTLEFIKELSLRLNFNINAFLE